MSKVLILFAHPSQSKSEINVLLFNASKKENVTLVDLYNEYPTYRINIKQEQKRLMEHDIIIFMFPLYWYSTPAILKEWQDLVLEHGFAYGVEGNALRGKTFICATTAGGPESAYQGDSDNHQTISDLLQPLKQMAHLCGMRYIPPYVLFGSRTAVEEDRLNIHIEQWETLLTNMINDDYDFDTVINSQLLNPINHNGGIEK